MKKIIFSVILVSVFSSSALSKPIWEISNHWKCETFLHTKINKNGDVIGINESANTLYLDFRNLEL